MLVSLLVDLELIGHTVVEVDHLDEMWWVGFDSYVVER